MRQLICGPPCSGKTTLALKMQAQQGGVVIDHDLIAQQLGSPTSHHHGQALRDQAERVISELLRQVERGEHEHAWIVRGLPNPTLRQALADRLSAEIVLLNPPRATLLARAQQRPRPDRTVWLIDRWLKQSSPFGG